MKRHRIYYMPGMISLIVLPILCFYYIIPYKKDVRVLEVVCFDRYNPDIPGKYVNIDNQKYYSKNDTTILSLPEFKRMYNTILLNGGKDNDLEKLELFRKRIVKMKNDKDTISGVHLQFGDNSSYGAFVQSIDICLKEDIIHYGIYRNNLWVIHKNHSKEYIENRKKRKLEALEANKRMRTLMVSQLKLSSEDRINMVKKLWPISLILIILSYLSIRKLIQLNKHVC